ncbi:hypothetical protein BG003_010768 [Podila horticola]|nr:hypothetical protein BG003_010768 [Podila horticola]
MLKLCLEFDRDVETDIVTDDNEDDNKVGNFEEDLSEAEAPENDNNSLNGNGMQQRCGEEPVFYCKMLLTVSPLAMSAIGTDAEDGPASKRRKTKKVVSETA